MLGLCGRQAWVYLCMGVKFDIEHGFDKVVRFHLTTIDREAQW
jgi:hypothetical protein